MIISQGRYVIFFLLKGNDSEKKNEHEEVHDLVVAVTEATEVNGA